MTNARVIEIEKLLGSGATPELLLEHDITPEELEELAQIQYEHAQQLRRYARRRQLRGVEGKEEVDVEIRFSNTECPENALCVE